MTTKRLNPYNFCLLILPQFSGFFFFFEIECAFFVYLLYVSYQQERNVRCAGLTVTQSHRISYPVAMASKDERRLLLNLRTLKAFCSVLVDRLPMAFLLPFFHIPPGEISWAFCHEMSLLCIIQALTTWYHSINNSCISCDLMPKQQCLSL